ADMLGDDFKDEKRFKLSRVIPGEKFKFTYEYDFGDGWGHTILVEKIFRPEKELKAPVCLDGKRSAPPEDCGGKGGYRDVLKALKNPSHPDSVELREWLGEYDPEYFDAEIVNGRLKKIR
ncbi:MAG: plasmid pRiA4b ORF-3 family protein, partial [Methanothrix sp.]|nr:plasmid pRiA4b ORF-3 family protein [Methanothrix sp.]